jgi:hypothetical protein
LLRVVIRHALHTGIRRPTYRPFAIAFRTL